MNGMNETDLVKLISLREVFLVRAEALKNCSKTVFEKEVGRLLGGRVVVRVEFDMTESFQFKADGKTLDI